MLRIYFQFIYVDCSFKFSLLGHPQYQWQGNKSLWESVFLCGKGCACQVAHHQTPQAGQVCCLGCAPYGRRGVADAEVWRLVVWWWGRIHEWLALQPVWTFWEEVRVPRPGTSTARSFWQFFACCLEWLNNGTYGPKRMSPSAFTLGLDTKSEGQRGVCSGLFCTRECSWAELG